MLQIIFEIIFQIIFEIVGQIVFELLASLGWESLKDSWRRQGRAHPVLSSIGHLLLGLIAGIISVVIIPQRLAPRSSFPGLSLVLSPLGTGAVMHALGRLRGEADKPVFFSFRAGAIFAFGMALVRFVYVGLEWRPF